MCEINEDFHDRLECVQDVEGGLKKCVKCKEANASVVIKGGDAHCRACFKENFTHKFRATLGKNRVIFPGEKVLLAVSGGPSSCSMLRQVQEGLSQNAHKKLRFLPGIVYIDEGGAVFRSSEERQKTVAQLQAIFKATGYPFHIVPLEQVLDLPSSTILTAPSASQPAHTGAYKTAVDQFIQHEISSSAAREVQEETDVYESQEPHTQALQKLIGSAKTLTAKQDLVNTLRQHVLVHTARSKGYSKVMLGDSCTRLAVKLLSNISTGRGAHLAQDTGFSDTRHGDVILVRPMRDYSAKEIAYYNHVFAVPSVFIPGLDTKNADKASIHRLTESFVNKLQADFPSTVSTIYRTSEKLQTVCGSSSTADPCDRCLLCVCALDTADDGVSALQATLTSEKLSKFRGNTRPGMPVLISGELRQSAPTVRDCRSGEGENCGQAQVGGSCCSSDMKPEKTDLKSTLCYSCQLIVKDLSSVECLPQYILSEAMRRQRRSLMRKEISEFLLDDCTETD
ncbi:cytoplasmic tRNA 2-thiolation protein 2 isoform X1 [Cynoglossus semilaevis]|uniref:cytoplasmic tRNA 2-thiolation protein 2 isoform X1 n=1 Tax=Cynoglossus semilaevis TaxID=244447 RepID=UPI000496DDE4|nr:cytoplasmic tRNA 2-thiolation protein 2 isoform X1 [Cynoglossus semilaevis]